MIGYRNTGHFVIDRFLYKDLISEAPSNKENCVWYVNVQKEYVVSYKILQ